MISRILYLFPIVLYSEMSEEEMPSKQTTLELFVTYTFLTARQDGLAVSYSTDVDGLGDGRSTFTSPTIDPQSGFKLGATYLFDHDNLDLTFSYRWFYNRDNPYTPASLPESSDMNSSYSTWGLSFTPSIRMTMRKFVFGHSASAWNNSFNRVDLSLGRSCYISSLQLRPYLGVLFAWDNQDYIVSYGLKDTNTPKIAEWNNTQNWYGMGPYVGLQPSFILWASLDHSLSICGKGGGALTWSKANALMQFYSGEEATFNDSNLLLQYRDLFLYISPMIELFLGICWESILYDHWSAKVNIGWEQEYWFEHNRMFGINNYPPSGGLYSMQGLNISIGAGF